MTLFFLWKVCKDLRYTVQMTVFYWLVKTFFYRFSQTNVITLYVFIGLVVPCKDAKRWKPITNISGAKLYIYIFTVYYSYLKCVHRLEFYDKKLFIKHRVTLYRYLCIDVHIIVLNGQPLIIIRYFCMLYCTLRNKGYSCCLLYQLSCTLPERIDILYNVHTMASNRFIINESLCNSFQVG